MSRRPRRVLVALDVSAGAAAALEAARRFAEHGESLFEGLFVEDEEIFDLAEHPAARVVSAFEPGTSPPAPSWARQAHRAAEERIEALWRAFAEVAGGASELRKERGRRSDVIVAAASGADVVIFCKDGHERAIRVAVPVLSLGPGEVLAPPLLVVTGEVDADALADAAGLLASVTGDGGHVLAADERVARVAASRVMDVLASRGVDAQLDTASLASLAARISALRGCTLVVGRARSPDLERALRGARVPLLVSR